MSDSITPKKIGPRDEHWNWRGGRIVSSHGYIKVLVGIGKPGTDSKGYAYEHRVVAEEMIGRPLKKGEMVHHIDGDKANNTPSNIKVCETVLEHLSEHRTSGKKRLLPGQRNRNVLCACGCGESFRRFDNSGRWRKYVSGHNTKVEYAKGKR